MSLISEFNGSVPRLRLRGMRLILRWHIGIDLLAKFCADNLVSIVDMQSGPRSGKHKEIVALRRQFCMIAKANGVGPIYIGRLLKMNHSTVIYHTNSDFRARKRAGCQKYDRNRSRSKVLA